MNDILHAADDKKTEWMFARVFDRITMLRKHKDNLLDTLNVLDWAWSIISKIQHWSIITKSEHQLIKKFIENRGLSTDISSVYHDTLTSRNKEWTLNDLDQFTQMAEKYPFVVDADQVSENHIIPLPGEEFIQLYKDGYAGLIKKVTWESDKNGIKMVLEPTKYKGLICFDPEIYKRYGIIEIRNNRGWSLDYDTTFLQKKTLGNQDIEFTELCSHKLIHKFDKDNVAIASKWSDEYILLYQAANLDESAIWATFKIRELSKPFKADIEVLKHGFDWYNSLSTNAIIFKKKYDAYGKMVGIDAFQKNMLGKEKLVRDLSVQKSDIL